MFVTLQNDGGEAAVCKLKFNCEKLRLEYLLLDTFRVVRLSSPPPTHPHHCLTMSAFDSLLRASFLTVVFLLLILFSVTNHPLQVTVLKALE